MGVTVLVVDDAAFWRNTLRERLEGAGHTVVEAMNGWDAVRSYRQKSADIVLMDLVMPMKDGVSATEEILAIDPLARVVVCGDRGQERLIEAAIAAGAVDFLRKPNRMKDDEVVPMVESLVTAPRAARNPLARLRALDEADRARHAAAMGAFRITVSGVVEAEDPKALDGRREELDLAEYIWADDELDAVGLIGGDVVLQWNETTQTLVAVTTYRAPRDLTAREREALVAFTIEQWIDGVDIGVSLPPIASIDVRDERKGGR